jgi:hypothetical protein
VHTVRGIEVGDGDVVAHRDGGVPTGHFGVIAEEHCGGGVPADEVGTPLQPVFASRLRAGDHLHECCRSVIPLIPSPSFADGHDFGTAPRAQTRLLHLGAVVQDARLTAARVLHP